MLHAMNYSFSQQSFFLLLCEKNNMPTGKKEETKPISAINTFPLRVTYRHVLFGKLQIRF